MNTKAIRIIKDEIKWLEGLNNYVLNEDVKFQHLLTLKQILAQLETP